MGWQFPAISGGAPALRCVALASAVGLLMALSAGILRADQRAAEPIVGEPIVRVSSRTGLARSVTASEGGGGTGFSPVVCILEYGHLFGIADARRELVLEHSATDRLGHTHTTYQQVHQGVPVFSGVLRVHQDAGGRFLAANGRFHPLPAGMSTEPLLDAESAARIAAAMVDSDSVQVAMSRLVIVDPGWYGDPPLGARLAYYLVLADPLAGIEQAFFVDAHKGVVLDRWSQLCHALDRSIHLHGGIGGEPLPGPLARAEGDPPAGVADVDAAYDYAGDAYDYFNRGFGRDGLDDAGMTIVATVNTAVFPCPNAGWSFTRWQMAFCPGTVADDIVAHEFTHGVVQSTANLIYQNQPGQLNESFCDVFGELADLFNGDAAFAGPPGGPPYWPTHPTGPGSDAPNGLRTTCSPYPDYIDGLRWLIGEDAAAFGGPLRDMWEPVCRLHPDRTTSPLQTCSLIDSGGVHSGSGIPNHAFAILTDGKTFNGITVTGIGPIKAGAVWYRALTSYLTVASDFEDAYWAFNQAAADLVGTFPADPRTGLPSGSVFTAGDAEEVDQALRAVEMDLPGACGESVPVLDSEPPGRCGDRTMVFADDFESGVGGWTVSNTGPPTPYDWMQTTTTLPFGRPGVAWLCADANIGDCAGSSFAQGADDCAQADLISGEGTFSFDNASAGQDGAADCPAGGDPAIAHDVWFCWRSGCDGAVTVETCGLTSVDTKIAVYDGCGCPPAAPLACDDDACDTQSRVTFAATDGANYLIRIGTAPGQSGGTGEFSISSVPSCGEAAVHSLFSPVIELPPDLDVPTLSFTHYVETEPRYDGGNLRISVNSGPWEAVPAAAFRHNTYNTSLYMPGQENANPLAGQVGFSGAGGEWGMSLVDLGVFAAGGDTIQVRFDFGKDRCFGFTGWYLDDFEVYGCGSSSDCNDNGVPDEVDVAQGPAVELLLRQVANGSSGNLSDADPHPSLGVNKLSENFRLLRDKTIRSLKIWGGYAGAAPESDDFTVKFHANDAGLPGEVIAEEVGVSSIRFLTGRVFSPNVQEWEYALTLSAPVSLPVGTYFIEIYNDTTGYAATFVWERAWFGWLPGAAYHGQGCQTWCYEELINFSLEMYGDLVGRQRGDLNASGSVDLSDVGEFVEVLLHGTEEADVFCSADINQDGTVDGEDIGGFTGCVLQGECP